MSHRTTLGFALAAVITASSFAAPASAQEAVQRTDYRPNKPLIATGLVTFGVPYIISVFVAATSNVDSDRSLYVPLAGPWIDLGMRGGCPATGNCRGETEAKAGLVLDGIFQGIGVITMASGFLSRSDSTTVVTHRAALDFVAPYANASGGGLRAVGHF